MAETHCCGGGLDIALPTAVARRSPEPAIMEPSPWQRQCELESIKGLLEDQRDLTSRNLKDLLQEHVDGLEERISGRIAEELMGNFADTIKSSSKSVVEQQAKLLKKYMEKLETQTHRIGFHHAGSREPSDSDSSEDEVEGKKKKKLVVSKAKPDKPEKSDAPDPPATETAPAPAPNGDGEGGAAPAAGPVRAERRQARTNDDMFQGMKKKLSVGASPNYAGPEDQQAGKVKNKYQEEWAFDDIVSEGEEETGETVINSYFGRMVETNCFKMFSLFLISSNSIFIAVQTQYAASNLEEIGQPAWMLMIDMAYCVCFIVEILVRFLAEKLGFFYGREAYWNIFDLTLVILATQDSISTLILFSTGQEKDDDEEEGNNFTYLRMIRILRILRLIRLFKFCPQLSLMITGIIQSLMSMVWVFALLGMVVFMTGLVFVSATTNFLQAPESAAMPTERQILGQAFGSIPASVLCLFKAISGGLEWERVGDALFEISSIYGLLLCAYITFIIFGLANMFIAIFADSVSKKSRQAEFEMQQEMMNDMKHVLIDLDEKQTGFITKEDFAGFLEGKGSKLLKVIKQLDLKKSEARRYFDLVDMWDEKKVDIKNLTRSFLRLAGGARSQDLIFLMYENRRLAKNFHSFCFFVEMKFRGIYDCLKIEEHDRHSLIHG